MKNDFVVLQRLTQYTCQLKSDISEDDMSDEEMSGIDDADISTDISADEFIWSVSFCSSISWTSSFLSSTIDNRRWTFFRVKNNTPYTFTFVHLSNSLGTLIINHFNVVSPVNYFLRCFKNVLILKKSLKLTFWKS